VFILNYELKFDLINCLHWSLYEFWNTWTEKFRNSQTTV